MIITFEPVGIFLMQFSMLYSGEQILSFKPCLVFYAGVSLNFWAKSKIFVELLHCANLAIFREADVGGIVFYKHRL